MTTEPVSTSPPEPLELGVERANRAWRRLGMRVRSITPSAVGRYALIGLALWTLGSLIAGSWTDLFPFQIGLVLAYITLPLVNWFARFMPRAIAVLLMVIIEIAALIGIVALLVPPIVVELTGLVLSLPSPDDLREALGAVRAQMALLPEPTRELIQNGTDQASTAVRGHLLLLVQSAAAVAIAGALGVLNTLGFIIALLGVPTWLFAVMTDQRRGVRLFNNLFPREARTDVWAVLRILDRTFSSWIRGQLGLAVLVGVGVFFGLWALEQLGIASIKYRLVLAVIATIMQLIPAVGPILGALPAVVAGFTQSREAGVAILLLYASIQWLLGSIVAPQFQRRGPDMHPAIMVVILVLLAPFGFFWILVAAPLAIGTRDLFRYVYGRLGEPPRPAGLLPGETVPVAPMRPRWR